PIANQTGIGNRGGPAGTSSDISLSGTTVSLSNTGLGSFYNTSFGATVFTSSPFSTYSVLGRNVNMTATSGTGTPVSVSGNIAETAAGATITFNAAASSVG